MKYKKVIAQFDARDLILAEELICDIFFSADLKGVVCDIPIEEPDEGFGTNTLPTPETYSITGFLPFLDSSDILLAQIRKEARKLSDLDITVQIKTEIVDEKDWAEAWKEHFNVTRITDRITIKPEWKPHTPRPGEVVIHLDPGMAFGTGTHPTTAMCLKLLDIYLTPGSFFLDIGTGSGILMIAAAKLGAGHLSGLDTDEVAIEVASKNLAKNDIRPDLFDLWCTTLDKTQKITYDFIAANIISQVIVNILPDIAARMTCHTIVLLSGIIKERQADVMTALEACRLYVVHEEIIEEWVTLAVKQCISKQS